MAVSARQRKALPKSAFALPSKRRYPINTIARARAALSYSARKDTVGSPATVRRAVYKRYPQLRKKR